MLTQSTRVAPVADWFDPHIASQDPYPTYQRLRELGPVVWVPALNRYFLTAHEAVANAEQNPEAFSSHSEQNLSMMHALGGRPMLRKDDPDHARERSAINPTLRPKAIKTTWAPQFDKNVATWLDRMIEIGPEAADLNRDFAAPVASQNLLDLIGFPEGIDVEAARTWSLNYIAGIGNVLDDPQIWQRCNESQAEVNAILDDLLPYLRRHPNGSITSHLLEVGLPEEAVRANVHLTISGGMNEPQHMITNLVWALSEHPEERSRVLSGEVSWSDAFEEAARWLSPIGMIPREVVQDVELGGVELRAGDNVGLLLGSANRDEAVFADGGRFDVTRTARGHLAFGSGVHMCAGRWAAKSAVADYALPELYRRLPGLDVDRSRSVEWNGWVFRGITALPVTW